MLENFSSDKDIIISNISHRKPVFDFVCLFCLFYEAAWPIHGKQSMQTDSMSTNHMFVVANQYWKNQNFIFDEQLSGKSKFYTQLSL